jgi:predicted RNA polymerase sigma factor
MVALNRVVALAMVEGAQAGLDALAAACAAHPALAQHHRLDSVRAHLLEMRGDPEAARVAYLRAAARTLSLPEQGYLRAQAARLGDR